MSDSQIVTKSSLLTPDSTWQSIVEKLISELNEEDLPEEVVQVTEMLLSGYSQSDAAKKLKIRSETIRRWLTMYPTMAAILAEGRQMLSVWRMSKLEQQFLTAVEKSQEILEVDLDGYLRKDNQLINVDPKVLTVVAAQARYIIGLFASQQAASVTVTHEVGETVARAQESALDYIASKLSEQRDKNKEEPLDVAYRVIDPKVDNDGPLLDETGNPPFGVLGTMDKNDEGVLCHICGRRYSAIQAHILKIHSMGTVDYEDFYMLEPGTIVKVEHSK